MSTTNYKYTIGDMVKVVRDETLSTSCNGKIGKIVCIYPNSVYHYLVQFEDWEEWWTEEHKTSPWSCPGGKRYYCEDEIELTSDTYFGLGPAKTATEYSLSMSGADQRLDNAFSTTYIGDTIGHMHYDGRFFYFGGHSTGGSSKIFINNKPKPTKLMSLLKKFKDLGLTGAERRREKYLKLEDGQYTCEGTAIVLDKLFVVLGVLEASVDKDLKKIEDKENKRK